MKATIELEIDLALFIRQKQALLRQIEDIEDPADEERGLLQGLLNFCDWLTDEVDPPTGSEANL